MKIKKCFISDVDLFFGVPLFQSATWTWSALPSSKSVAPHSTAIWQHFRSRYTSLDCYLATLQKQVHTHMPHSRTFIIPCVLSRPHLTRMFVSVHKHSFVQIYVLINHIDKPLFDIQYLFKCFLNRLKAFQFP